MKEIRVSAGIIQSDDKILCVQRGKGKFEYISYKYEFPGGKIEGEENPKDALMRELMEEMDMEIIPDSMEHFMTVHHTYPDFRIEMHAFLCPVEEPRFTLLEHIDFQWLPADRLHELDWAGADWPIVKALGTRMNP